MRSLPLHLLALSIAGCQLFSGLDELDVANGGAAPATTSASASAASTSGGPNGTSSGMQPGTTASTTGGGGGGGPCGDYGEACCAGQCNEPTLACTPDGKCGGCGESMISPGCVRRVDGRVFCWGSNDSGELGIPNMETVALPTESLEARDAVRRARAGSFKEASWFQLGARALAVGDEDDGELGNGAPVDETVTSFEDVGLAGVTTVVGAVSVMCAILDTGELACAGRNSAGEFLNDNYGEDHASPVVLPHGTDNVDACGYGRTLCTAKIDGSAQCWGYNYPRGMLGNGDTTTDFSPAAVDVSVPTVSGGFRSLVSGDGHHCAIGFDDQVYCWGANDWVELGQLGADSAVPIVVPTLPLVDTIAAGNSFTCVVTQAQEAWCWGHNDGGQLGHPDDVATPNDELPAKVDLPAPVVMLDTDYRTACALLVDGSVWCWGGNFGGELGIGTTGAGSHLPQRALVDCAP